MNKIILPSLEELAERLGDREIAEYLIEQEKLAEQELHDEYL